jgi:hypothetical protein
MRFRECSLLPCALAGLACAGNPVAGRASAEKAALAVEDEPLPVETADPVGAGEAPRPRIRIDSASLGANCGQPEGNETANLAKRCDGRRRCNKRVMLKTMSRTFGNGRSIPCVPEYLAKWTCGEDSLQQSLRSIPSEEANSRLRLGCGPEDPFPVRGTSPPVTDVFAMSAAGDTVRGRVVRPTGVPIARRRVFLGGTSVLTDADGGFVFHGVPESYDVRVIDWYGWAPASVYLGLTRRNPVLVVRETAPSAAAWRYHASITDAVSTTMAAHEGTWGKRVVQFLSPRGWPWNRGDRYRELEVDWRGGNALTGTFVTLVGYGSKDDPWASAYLATSPLSLADGDAVAASPRLHKIGSGRIAGKARLRGPLWPSSSGETLRFSYVVPGLLASIDLGECPANGSYDCQLPDLSELGGEYCMVIGVESSNERVSRCGGRLGMEDFSVTPASPAPVLRHGAEVDEDTMVAWTGEGRVFELRLGPSHSANIRVYTAKQSFSWSDFVALGLDWSEFLRVGFGFGKSHETEPVIEVFTVSALYPYESMDVLASGRGVMATGTSWRKVPSARDNFPSTKGHVAVPESVVSRLRAVKAPPSEPLDLFHLPACTSTAGAMAIGAIRPAMVETRVSLRATLTWEDGWGCTLMGCQCCNSCSTEWIITDPKVKGSGMLIQRNGGPLSIGANECKIPTPPHIEVIATGRLIRSLGESGPAQSHPFFLDEFSLCAVKPEAGLTHRCKSMMAFADAPGGCADIPRPF